REVVRFQPDGARNDQLGGVIGVLPDERSGEAAAELRALHAPALGAGGGIEGHEVGAFVLITDEIERAIVDNRRRRGAELNDRSLERLLPSFLALEIVGEKPERAEVNVDEAPIRGRRGRGGIAEPMRLLEFVARSGLAPEEGA